MVCDIVVIGWRGIYRGIPERPFMFKLELIMAGVGGNVKESINYFLPEGGTDLA